MYRDIFKVNKKFTHKFNKRFKVKLKLKKKIIHSFIVAFLSTMFLTNTAQAGANQIWLTNGVWQPVGIQGIYKLYQNATSWEADSTTIIEDRADSNTTYARGDEKKANNFYVDKDNNLSITYNVATSKIHATVGLFAIKNGTSKKKSNYIILDGSQEKNVRIKILNIRNKDYNIPMYRMYVEGRKDVPAVRIDYQGDYEGDKFRIKFGEEEEDYYGYFRATNTWTDPAKLYVEIEDEVTSSSPIDRAVDFNISDNSLLLLSENAFKILDADGITIGGDGVTRFNSADGDFIDIYSFNAYQNKWDIFSSKNTNIGSNDFEDFEPGKGYWIKADSKRANDDGNKSKIGIITKNESEIYDKTYKNVVEGWNMLSFPESDLRYATSGMFIPLGAINSGGINLFFSHLGNTNTDANNSRENNITLAPRTDINTSDPADMAQAINVMAKSKKILYSEETNIRAFPALRPNLMPGVVVISDHLFEINSSNSSITTLTGASLVPTSHNTYSSIYGEHILAIDMNDLSGTEINGSIDIFMSGASFNSAGAKAYDLNDTKKELNMTALKIKKALIKAATPLNKTQPGTRSDVILIDFAFEHDITKKVYDVPEKFGSILLATQTRFSVRDITYMQVFKQENNGSFYVVGQSSELTTSGGGVSLKDAINNERDKTAVSYTDLGNNYFVISSPITRNLDLLEADNKFDSKLFTDIYLNDGNIPRKNLTKGAVSIIRDHVNIMSPDIKVNLRLLEGNKTMLPKTKLIDFNPELSDNGAFKISGNFPFIKDDLKPNAIWSKDFPNSDGPINIMAKQGMEILEIMTMNKSSANENYWAYTDLTKDPDTWYTSDQKDTQDIFHIFNQKAYWIRLKKKMKKNMKNYAANEADANSKNSEIFVSGSTFKRRIYTHFNNHITNAIGETKNHLDHTLTIQFKTRFMDPNNHPYYDVSAVIAGEEHKLRHNGQGFQIRISSNELNIREKVGKSSKYPILIKAYDGFGSSFEENASISGHQWEMDYSKPFPPNLKWDTKTGELMIATTDNIPTEIYQDYISDISLDRVKNLIKNHKLSENKNLAWKIPGNNIEGEMKVLKIIVKKEVKNNNYLYSDMKVVPYVPLKFGHVLAVEKNTSKNIVSVPYSFIQQQYLTFKAKSDSITPKFNGKNGIDNGVELQRLKQAIEDKEAIKMVYYPVGNKEGDKRLNAFGGHYTMYLKVLSKFHTNPKPIAYITYIKEYAGKPFYISYNGNLYQGFFADDNSHNNDANSYNLYSGSISAYFDTRGKEGNLIDYSTSSFNSQPIIIPMGAKVDKPKPADNNSTEDNDTKNNPPVLP